MADKLSIINDALIATGNTPVLVAGDGTDEWNAGSRAYERSVRLIMERHDWNFATEMLALVRLGASTFPGMADIYEKPANCLHLISVWDTDAAAQITTRPQFYRSNYNPEVPPLEYKIIDDAIHCVAPNGAKALYVPEPKSDMQWPAGFQEALTLEIESILLRGLNEDYASSKDSKMLARDELDRARARTDNEEPRRAAFKPRLRQARLHRRA